jgi:hypothetical protein
VHGDKQLFNPAYPEKMRKAAEASLRKRGVDLILGDYVDIAETTEVSGISTRSGKAIKSADLVVCLFLWAWSARSNVSALFRSRLVALGRTQISFRLPLVQQPLATGILSVFARHCSCKTTTASSLVATL